jgi:hydroxymethylpyrimidine pyrophosphatase-like HAD family hydrolase
MSNYQDKLKRGHARKKKRLIGTGGHKELKYGAKRPSYKRSKSAPAGFSTLEENSVEKIATFDFDETLAIWHHDDWEKVSQDSFYPNIKTVLKMRYLKNEGYEIHIVTSRHRSRSAPVFNFVSGAGDVILNRGTDSEERIKISDLVNKDNIHFAGGDKATILKDLNSKVHFDDDEEEFKIYRRMYPEDDIEFQYIKFDITWNNYYEHGLLPNETSIQRFEQKSEVKHESKKSSNKNNRCMRKRDRRNRRAFVRLPTLC